MVCIYCGHETRVTNSRPQKRLSGTWRRHLCKQCGAIFTSLERADYQASWRYEDAESHIVPFDRDTLLVSVYEACKHRPDAVRDATALAETIIGKLLQDKGQRGLITRAWLIEVATQTLHAFDTVAGVYYAAYHRAGG